MFHNEKGVAILILYMSHVVINFSKNYVKWQEIYDLVQMN